MHGLAILGTALALVSGAAQAVTVPFETLGPPSGFRQEFRLDFVGTVVSADATLYGGRTDFYYDSSYEELSENSIEFQDSCSAPGVCVAFSSAVLRKGPNDVRFLISTARGFNHCEPLGSVEGFCGRLFATPRISVLTNVAGSGAFSVTVGQLVAVPEPAQWLMLIAGFGAIGGLLRRSRAAAALLPAA